MIMTMGTSKKICKGEASLEKAPHKAKKGSPHEEKAPQNLTSIAVVTC